MTGQSPVDTEVLEHRDRGLASESTVGTIEDILSRDADLGVGDGAGEAKVDGGRGNDNLSVGVESSGVEVGDDGLDGLRGPVPDGMSVLCPEVLAGLFKQNLALPCPSSPLPSSRQAAGQNQASACTLHQIRLTS